MEEPSLWRARCLYKHEATGLPLCLVLFSEFRPLKRGRLLREGAARFQSLGCGGPQTLTKRRTGGGSRLFQHAPCAGCLGSGRPRHPLRDGGGRWRDVKAWGAEAGDVAAALNDALEGRRSLEELPRRRSCQHVSHPCAPRGTGTRVPARVQAELRGTVGVRPQEQGGAGSPRAGVPRSREV